MSENLLFLKRLAITNFCPVFLFFLIFSRISKEIDVSEKDMEDERLNELRENM